VPVRIVEAASQKTLERDRRQIIQRERERTPCDSGDGFWLPRDFLNNRFVYAVISAAPTVCRWA